MSRICNKCSSLIFKYANSTPIKIPLNQIVRNINVFKPDFFDKNVDARYRKQVKFCKFSTNVEDESKLFSEMAKDWWNENGDMKALHSMNELRVPFIRDCLLYQGFGQHKTAKPLNGIDIIDVGCGAGVLCEPLARLGASVVGIDTCEEALEAAKIHRESQNSEINIQYIDSYLEDIAQVGSIKFDCVVASEVIEHVENQREFVQMCCTILKPGGSLFISTLNKTPLSYGLGIVMAEKVLKVVPHGTHDLNKFISPNKLEEYVSEGGCTVRKLHGMNYNPFQDMWSWADHHEISYILHATKDDLNTKPNTVESMPEES